MDKVAHFVNDRLIPDLKEEGIDNFIYHLSVLLTDFVIIIGKAYRVFMG